MLNRDVWLVTYRRAETLGCCTALEFKLQKGRDVSSAAESWGLGSVHGAATVEVKEQNIHRQSVVLSKLCVWGKELQNALNSIVMWGK